mgnify:CR=1 FL=1
MVSNQIHRDTNNLLVLLLVYFRSNNSFIIYINSLLIIIKSSFRHQFLEHSYGQKSSLGRINVSAKRKSNREMRLVERVTPIVDSL